MEKQPFRVLQVVSLMNRGGIETMLMNHYRRLDTSRVQFDFIVHYDFAGAYDEEILARGGRIFHAPSIRPWSYPRYFRWFRKFFAEHGHEFTAVHAHLQENSGFPLHFAKKAGIERRLATSHIAMIKKDYKYLFRRFAIPYLRHSVTERLACGEAAGRALYGNEPFTVMPNAIDVARFRFDPSTRAELRAELGIKRGQPVVGLVGRFTYQKNHERVISIFEAFHKKHPDSILMLVGTGEKQEGIRQLVAQKNLTDSVKFLGSRDDIHRILQAMDVFLMPSLFEGLPVSVIEAEAAGLPAVLSDTIDPTTDVTGKLAFVSLEAPDSEWAEALEAALATERTDTSRLIADAGYDVAENGRIMLGMYGIPSESITNHGS